MRFSEKLKKLRSGRGISQSELAAALYVSRSAVAKWENGLGFPCEQSLKEIAEYFSVSEDYLCEDSIEELSVSGAEKTGDGKMPRAARVCSLVATILLFVYAMVISAFLVSQDCFDGGLSILSEAMIVALILVGVAMSALEFVNGKIQSSRFLAYGVGVGVGVFFASIFACSYLGYLKYGSFCVGAPALLIAVNETMLYIVRRVYNVEREYGESGKSSKGTLYVCLALAMVMCGLCIYPQIVHVIQSYYSIGIIIFSAALFVSVFIALLVAITKPEYTQSALAFGFGALIYCGIQSIAPCLSGNSPYITQYSFYEYLSYELTALIFCGVVLILALCHYLSYFMRVVSVRLRSVTVNN